MNDNFYRNIKSYEDFNDTFNAIKYHSVPDDWCVVIADIENSTDALDLGKYKDVNLIGSACIGAVLSIDDFPFVFGGDGASFVVPLSKISEVKKELLEIKKSSEKRYSLRLRIGIVPVSDISKVHELKIAKYKLSTNRYIAKFSGGGLLYADSLIKSDSKYLIQNSQNDKEASFNGISCRWNPIESENGVILTLMLKAEKFEDYKEVQNKLDQILGTDQASLNPVKPGSMSYMTLSDILKNEKKYEKKFLSVSSFKRIFEIFFAFFIFKPFRSLQPKFLKHYTNSMQRYSDYRKFDDILRMVIDCSDDQMKKIITLLDSIESLKYGYSCSKQALMTCLVFGLDDGEHIHFIDGADGGYYKAATMMKAMSFK